MRDFDGDITKLANHRPTRFASGGTIRMKTQTVPAFLGDRETHISDELAQRLRGAPALRETRHVTVGKRMYPEDGGLKEQVRSFEDTTSIFAEIVKDAFRSMVEKTLTKALWEKCDGELPFMLPEQPHRLIIIESPFGHPTKVGMEENAAYARRCMLDSLKRGEAPYASHLLYTQCLDDLKIDERKKGMEAGFAWGRVAQHVAVYVDRGISKGMIEGIKRHQANGKTIEFRSLEK